MVPLSTNMSQLAPDLTDEDYDIEHGFRCKVELKTDIDVATCLMPLPVRESKFAKGEYRFDPDDETRIT